ncbi:MAG: hypothetical protein JJE53_02565 [Candidatus Pacebacteria bacterium]|nr:hypothetical protein [Candidatus Paceibacterota bacterium]
MTVKITENQENKLCDLFRDALRSERISKIEAQEIIEKGNKFQFQIKRLIKKTSTHNDFIGKRIICFQIKIPNDYNDTKYINQFSEKIKEVDNVKYINDNISSENFKHNNGILIPGKTYQVKLFPIVKNCTSDDCLEFLKKEKVIFVGMHGIALVYTLRKEMLPIDRYILSFDKMEVSDNTDYSDVIPRIRGFADGDWMFYLCHCATIWSDKMNYIMAFYES